MPVTTTWRGITTDPETARYLAAVAAEVTSMTKAAGVPDFNVTPIRGCGSYQTSTEASAGTHAGGGAVDINAEGLTDKQARILESAARKWGGTAWFRPRVSPTGYVYGWQRHVHILRTDCTDLAYPSATRQVTDYRAGLNGLANRGPDTGNRSWVNVTWGAVKGIADTITSIGGAVVDVAKEEDIVASIDDLRRVIRDEIYSGRSKEAQDRVLGGIPGGSASERMAPDGKSFARVLDSSDGDTLRRLLVSIAGKVGVDVDEAAIASALLDGLKPAVAAAVTSAVAAGVPTGELADAVVARLGERLAQP